MSLPRLRHAVVLLAIFQAFLVKSEPISKNGAEPAPTTPTSTNLLEDDFQAPRHRCGPNEVFRRCVSINCREDNCVYVTHYAYGVDLRPRVCIRHCVPGCFCVSGTVRDRYGRCVHPDVCWSLVQGYSLGYGYVHGHGHGLGYGYGFLNPKFLGPAVHRVQRPH